MSVSTTGTFSCRTNSIASCEAMSPAPTTPTLVTFRASALSGAPAGRFARLLTRSNEYSEARSGSLISSSVSASSSAAVPAVKASPSTPLRASSSRSTDRTAPGEALRVRAATMPRARSIAASHADRSTSGR